MNQEKQKGSLNISISHKRRHSIEVDTSAKFDTPRDLSDYSARNSSVSPRRPEIINDSQDLINQLDKVSQKTKESTEPEVFRRKAKSLGRLAKKEPSPPRNDNYAGKYVKILPLRSIDNQWLPKLGAKYKDINSFSKPGENTKIKYAKLMDIDGDPPKTKLEREIEALVKEKIFSNYDKKTKWLEKQKRKEKIELERQIKKAHPKLQLIHSLRKEYVSSNEQLETMRHFVQTDLEHNTDAPRNYDPKEAPVRVYGTKSFVELREDQSFQFLAQRRIEAKKLRFAGISDLKSYGITEALTDIFNAKPGLDNERALKLVSAENTPIQRKSNREKSSIFKPRSLSQPRLDPLEAKIRENLLKKLGYDEGNRESPFQSPHQSLIQIKQMNQVNKYNFL